MTDKLFYTTKELCDMFGKCRHTIKNWREAGKLEYQKIGRDYFYPVDQFKVRKEGEA